MLLKKPLKFTLIASLLTICAVQVFAQNNVGKAIPGTKISLEPPPGFTAAKAFSGFQYEEKGASIMVTEIPAPFEQLAASFTADALKTRGMTLIAKTPVEQPSLKLGGGKAILIELSQLAAGTLYLKQMLMFGDGGKTIMINGIYPEANKILAPGIKTALLSAAYNEGQVADALSAANFTLNTDGTPFKFVKFIGGSLIYTTDAIMGTNKPSIVIGPALQKIELSARKEATLSILKKLPHQSVAELKSIEPIQAGPLAGYEIVAHGNNKDNKPELLYLATFFDNNGDCYIMVGEASEEFDSNLQIFKKASRTFRLR